MSTDRKKNSTPWVDSALNHFLPVSGLANQIMFLNRDLLRSLHVSKESFEKIQNPLVPSRTYKNKYIQNWPCLLLQNFTVKQAVFVLGFLSPWMTNLLLKKTLTLTKPFQQKITFWKNGKGTTIACKKSERYQAADFPIVRICGPPVECMEMMGKDVEECSLATHHMPEK